MLMGLMLIGRSGLRGVGRSWKVVRWRLVGEVRSEERWVRTYVDKVW